ncbi:MAG: hypothetical protein EAX90_05370 [Candidatus Heimdallarchaeota archaeon]|nr:hypothetical protein [Candidatus Heimdallarchaeota archaeon]
MKMEIKQFLDDLKNKDKKIREKAVDSLAIAQNPDTIKQLEEVLLKDKESSVRRRAALALGRIENEEACEALFKALTNDSDSETRRNAAIALGRFGDERAILPLYEFFSAPKKNNFFENIDRARVNLVLTELAQRKGIKTIEELVEWKKQNQ